MADCALAKDQARHCNSQVMSSEQERNRELNLFATQPHWQREVTQAREVIESREPKRVKFRDDLNEFVCEPYGLVKGADSALHYGGLIDGMETRPCVHSYRTPSPCTVLVKDWVFELHWLPTIYTGPDPVIASRRGDTVMVGFDAIGPTDGCQLHPTALPEGLRWSYRLYPLIFDEDGEVSPSLYLGVWAD